MRGCSPATCRSYIPGEPTIIVRNMPGAGGMVMSNYMYSQAPRDGLTIGMMSRANPIEPVLGNPAAKFKSEDFTWLGTSSSYERRRLLPGDPRGRAVPDASTTSRSPDARCSSARSPPAVPTPTSR